MSGIFLGAIWICEAATLIGLALTTCGAFSKSGKRVFCEDCNRWMNHRPNTILRSLEAQQFKDDLINGNPMPIINAPMWDGSTPYYSEIALFTCPSCTENQYATLNSVQLTMDQHNKIQTKATPVVDKLRISDTVAKAFQAASEQTPLETNVQATANSTNV